jgi:threonine dehydratase
MMITLEDIKQAKKNLDGIVRQTPLAYAPNLSEKYNAEIYLKKENLQLTGSFKLRGAFNKIANLDNDQRSLGVVAASAGNHAQGVAYSAKHFEIDATIVMPEATPLTKVSGVRSYGASVILHGNNYDEAYSYARKYAKEQNKTFIHPFATADVISGQGTIALELLEEKKDIDSVIVPIGGGGLIAGIAVALKEINPNIKIIGVVSSGANAMKRSYEKREALSSDSVRTIADGIAVRDVTPSMLEYLLKYVDEVVEVEDKEIANAILFLLEQHKLVVEGAGATTVAAIMHKKIDISNQKSIAILSGGNIDVTMLSVIIEKGLVKSYRKMNMIVTLIDKPGSLMELARIFNEAKANIVQIDYDRNSVKLDFGDANVTISLETKGEAHQDELREKLTSMGYRFKEL